MKKVFFPSTNASLNNNNRLKIKFSPILYFMLESYICYLKQFNDDKKKEKWTVAVILLDHK